ncbi:uncharacterized protein [Chironomus tepperi]|uniref:uncharacterized protein n=1 Tax=Chironomus tepperi TaxID=113505 RepID=UPI00391EE79B
MKLLVQILAVLAVLEIKGVFGLLPPNITICHRSDPHISDCIVNAIESIRDRLATGDLGDGYLVPPMEPFRINESNFGEEGGLRVFLRDLSIHGVSKFVIEKLRANPTDIKFDTLIYIPKLDIHGKYKMTFKFLGNLVNSDGDYYTQLTGPKLKFHMKGHRYMKDGQEFFKFEPFAVKFNRGKVSQLKISNLFGGNKLMGDIVHSIILSNPDFVLQNVYPKIEANLSKILTSLANKVVEKSSFDEMFPL